MFCIKTIKKIPMAAVGLVDLIACSADKIICSLAKRGEKAVKQMEKKAVAKKDCCCPDTATEHP